MIIIIAVCANICINSCKIVENKRKEKEKRKIKWNQISIEYTHTHIYIETVTKHWYLLKTFVFTQCKMIHFVAPFPANFPLIFDYISILIIVCVCVCVRAPVRQHPLHATPLPLYRPAKQFSCNLYSPLAELRMCWEFPCLITFICYSSYLSVCVCEREFLNLATV